MIFGKLFNITFLLLWISSFVFPLFFYLFLIYLKKNDSSILRSVFLVTARKSTSDAIQLGGVPISITIIFSWWLFLQIPSCQSYFDYNQILLMNYGLYAGMVIVAYGYLDDKFELRPIFKLFLQFVCLFTFSFLASKVLFSAHSTISFIVTFFWGVGVVNGANLQDGLDTLAIKLNMVIYAFFFAAGIYFQNILLTGAALLAFMPLMAFYFFNKEPAKIHLGEVGGSYIGMSLLILSTLVYKTAEFHFTPSFSLFFALIPLNLPMVELGVSLLRRVYNRRSPFKGDRLHVHHLLRNYHDIKASNVASILAIFSAITIATSLVISFVTHSIWGLISLIILQTMSYVMIGRKYWVTQDALDLSPKALFSYFRKKDVVIIDSNTIDDFQLLILEEEETSLSSTEEEIDKEDKEDKEEVA